MIRFAIPALALVLAACDGTPDAPTERGGEAAGEVLGGSISDAMIPLDTLTSQAPLAPRQGPPASSVDAEQPEVTPAPGIEGGPDAAPASPGVAPDGPEN